MPPERLFCANGHPEKEPNQPAPALGKSTTKCPAGQTGNIQAWALKRGCWAAAPHHWGKMPQSNWWHLPHLFFLVTTMQELTTPWHNSTLPPLTRTLSLSLDASVAERNIFNRRRSENSSWKLCPIVSLAGESHSERPAQMIHPQRWDTILSRGVWTTFTL